MIHLFDTQIDLVLIIALVLILGGVFYGVMLFVLSRFEPRQNRRQRNRRSLNIDSNKRDVVFLIPCLNEAEVIGASLDRLVPIDHPRLHILVIDDGSDDETAAIVRNHPDPRIKLLQRVAPNARQGKGHALNAAVTHIRQGGLGPDFNPELAILGVLDADGRLEPHVLEAVLPRFHNPALGGVQIGVRINNRTTNLLARMQDLEFVLYTEIFQRGRRYLGSVGLGGNGQFVRLSALNSLGERPWTDSLAEDLDLGIRLTLTGWSIDFCSATAVHQQGLTDLGRWIKQRTRWFQGHLQSWELVPWVFGRLKGRQRLDMAYHITSPFLLLVASLFTLAFVLWVVDFAIVLFAGELQFSWWWVSIYLVAFGPILLYGTIYWSLERKAGIGWFKTLGYFHLFAVYSTLWYLAGWRAVSRIIGRRTGWTKTDRVQEVTDTDSESGLVDHGQRNLA